MTNKYRGEIELEFAGTTYTVRPGFEFLSIIEQTTNLPTMTLMRRFVGGDFSARDVVHVLYAMLRDKIPGLTFKQVGEEVEEHGLNTFVPPIARLLTHALQGNKRMAELEAMSNPPTEPDQGEAAPPPKPRGSGTRRKK